ncbi:MAG: hypothetical protein ACJAR2_002846 [Ilumatobacter sp.]|jgi:hypothetical protein
MTAERDRRAALTKPVKVRHDVIGGTEQIQQLVISWAISGLRIVEI